eukprot:2928235-Prymnesium_polylepis.1
MADCSLGCMLLHRLAVQEAASIARGARSQATWQRELQLVLREMLITKLDGTTADFLLRADEYAPCTRARAVHAPTRRACAHAASSAVGSTTRPACAARFAARPPPRLCRPLRSPRFASWCGAQQSAHPGPAPTCAWRLAPA